MELIVGKLLNSVVAMGGALAPGFLLLLWLRRQRREKGNSIFSNILPGPGQALRRYIARLDEQLNALLLLLTFAPVVAVGWFLVPILRQGGRPGQEDYLPLLLLLVLFLPAPLLMFRRKIRERSVCRLDLDTRLVVGQELNLILGHGFQVLHDLPLGGDHIEHVVLGPSGIFTVASKGRPNPDKGKGGVDAKVIYNGEALYFPDNAKESAVVKRARQQAAALEAWLGASLGEPVQIRPALALPGWFVERKKPDDLFLLNGQSTHYARILNGPEVLPESLLKRIVQLLEAKYREEEAPTDKGPAQR